MQETQHEKKPDARHQVMLAALAKGATWEEAARRVGVNPSTLWRWCQAYPELADAAVKARSAADDLVEAVTFKNCLDEDPANNTLRMFWLKSRRPETYRETTRQIQEHTIKSYETANSPEEL